ncbi:T9SS type A sorting domain-containing protein, partial [candidate division KSB1 bacterium]
SEEAGGGSLSPDAREYTAPLSLNQSVEIRARSLNGGEWSPVHRAVYAIAEKMAQLRLTEIHFHPLDEADTNDREFEFVELKNIGADAIDLSLAGFRVGIDYTFASGIVLAPKQFIVLASNRAMFERRYGFAPFDVYGGNLDNAGERLVFVNAAGDTILNVRYNDKDPWPESADGGGYSLVAVDVEPQGDPNSPDYWAASYDLHGSAGKDDRAATLVHGHEPMPARYDLAQNYPNPFNARTTIRFELSRSGVVQLALYNILGQKVVDLADGHFDAGSHAVQWDAADFAGGLYFYRLQAGEFTETKKLILMK